MNRTTVLALTVAAQLALVGAATADRISARVFGEEHLLRVEPVDPIDPFRGAYVVLSYPDLRQADPGVAEWDESMPERDFPHGEVFVRLKKDGEYVVAAGPPVASRPEGLYLACESDGWDLDCGIESWFLRQDKARALEQAINDGEAVAHVMIDSRGHAALVDVEVP